MVFKADETAIVLIEFQNDFCKPGYPLYPGIEAVLNGYKVIENTVELVKVARSKGVLIVGCPIVFESDYKDLGLDFGIKANVKKLGVFRKGTKGSEFIDELKPYVDIYVEGKRGLDGFHGTNLDMILRYRGIKNVAIAGFLTNVCVESTARTAYDLNYKVIIVKDCTAAMSWEEQRYAEEKLFPLIAEVLTHKEFLERIK
ncbi:MAG: cysteine hydrolase [Sulfolobales archaeon]|nr:cysteine hydrolase [Sulfolobales archaeon]